jgi:hypothetical protein
MNLRTTQAMAPFLTPTGPYAWQKKRLVVVDEHARLTKAQALALLELGQGQFCILRVSYGPKGGWKDPVIVHMRSEFDKLKRSPHVKGFGYYMVRKIDALPGIKHVCYT